MDEASITCRGKEFRVSRNIISKIGIFAAVQTPDDSLIALELDKSPEIFKLIIDWLTHHAYDEQPYPLIFPGSNDAVQDNSLEPIVGWDREFIDKMAPLTFYTFVSTVIELEIDSLTKMVCREMAFRIKNKTIELEVEDAMKALTAK